MEMPLSYAGIVAGISRIYADPANRIIPISKASNLVCQQLRCRYLRGELDDAELEAELEKLRADFAREEWKTR